MQRLGSRPGSGFGRMVYKLSDPNDNNGVKYFDLNPDGTMIRLTERTTNQNAAFSNINPTPLGRLKQRQHILHPRVFSIDCTPLSTSNGSPQSLPSPFAAFRVADRQLRCPMLSHFQTSQDLKLMRVAALVRVFPAIAAFPPARAVRNEEQGVMHLDPWWHGPCYAPRHGCARSL